MWVGGSYIVIVVWILLQVSVAVLLVPLRSPLSNQASLSPLSFFAPPPQQPPVFSASFPPSIALLFLTTKGATRIHFPIHSER